MNFVIQLQQQLQLQPVYFANNVVILYYQEGPVKHRIFIFDGVFYQEGPVKHCVGGCVGVACLEVSYQEDNGGGKGG